MNYIRHLNAFFAVVRHDNRLTTSHISLYMALFQYWNFNRFQNPFTVYRNDIMRLSKIGSKNTYHKCMRELHQARYIFHHPSATKYQPVKISMTMLDKAAQKNPEQLELFAGNAAAAGKSTEAFVSPKKKTGVNTEYGTQRVSNLTDANINNEPEAIPDPGHLIKHTNNKQERNTPAHQIFARNGKIQNAINRPPFREPVPGEANELNGRPKLVEIERFFRENKYAVSEARKFYNHYKAIGWKIQGKIPIEDWTALAEKWMVNTSKWNGSGAAVPPDDAEEISVQFLYDRFCEGKNIFHFITAEHFDQLGLSLTDEVMTLALQERIKQVSGTNQHSLNLLWDAYLKGDIDHVLLRNDKPNLTLLAKQISIVRYFSTLRISSARTTQTNKGQL